MATPRNERDANIALQARADSLQWNVGRTFTKPAPRHIIATRPGLVARILRAILGA